MFPWSQDFTWDAGNVVFLGAFYVAVLVIAGTLLLALRRTLRGLSGKRAGAILWHADFEELPASARRCRHELTGEIRSRSCPHAFDCRSCETHVEMAAARQDGFVGSLPGCLVSPATADDSAFGFSLPLDRLYHRGHTWAHPEPDGTVTVGLDDLGRRLLGTPDRLELPPAGSALEVNGVALLARKGTAEVRILSPVDGTVVETGSAEEGWLLRVAPPAGGFDLGHLLAGAEVRLWFLREVERLERVLSADSGTGPALADGGSPVEDLSQAIPPAERNRTLGEMFLEP